MWEPEEVRKRSGNVELCACEWARGCSLFPSTMSMLSHMAVNKFERLVKLYLDDRDPNELE